MFSKENYIKYFNQILTMEQEMENTFLHISENLSSNEYKKIFNRLAHEERIHQQKIKEIIDLFID